MKNIDDETLKIRQIGEFTVYMMAENRGAGGMHLIYPAIGMVERDGSGYRFARDT
ncbi:MAG: hypothetical protein LBH50_06395 [Spirochaetaceae bacterium]|nr:hypothetical protein [Spirochaetaceae bacterium]